MGKPDAPQPPNPYQTAAAQTGTNVSTAVANSFLQNANQVTPNGNLNWDVTGSYNWTDPSTGQTYNIPRWTSTQTLSPAGQQLQGQNDATKLNLATMANQQSARVGNLLNTPFNPTTGAPMAGDASTISNIGDPRSGYDAGGNITTSYGPDNFSQDRQRVEQALMDRLNPQLQKDRARIEQQLADQGIRYGSAAYSSAMDDYNRQSTDARFAAIGQAGSEQQRMMDMAAQQAGFQNAAQAQQNQQNAAQAGFYNSSLAQQLAQAQSAFNASNSGRNQYLQEQYAQRNQPLNEINAMLSSSPVAQPNWLNAPSSQIPTTDIAGIINQNFNQQQGNYNTQMNNWNSVMGGILGLGAGIIKSDRREKEDIVKMGSVLAADDGGERKQLPIYQYSYKDDPASAKHVGPMAQDVEKINPRAVVRDAKGTRYIKPDHVMGSIMRAS